MSTPVVPTTGWVCYARPIARHGQRCGHINEGATQNCSECGCAWKASEDRRVGRKPQRHHESPAGGVKQHEYGNGVGSTDKEARC